MSSRSVVVVLVVVLATLGWGGAHGFASDRLRSSSLHTTARLGTTVLAPLHHEVVDGAVALGPGCPKPPPPFCAPLQCAISLVEWIEYFRVVQAAPPPSTMAHAAWQLAQRVPPVSRSSSAADPGRTLLRQYALWLRPTHGSRSSQFLYFAFNPLFVGRVNPSSANATSITISTRCFEQVQINATWNNQSTSDRSTSQPRSVVIDVSISTAMPVGPNGTAPCQDQFQFWLPGFPLKFMGPNSVTIQRFQWDATALIDHNVSAAWFLGTHGIQVFLFPGSTADVLVDLIATAALFLESGPPLGNATVAANINFMNEYVLSAERLAPQITRRPGGSTVARSLRPFVDIYPGDALMIQRLDGLDPTLSWMFGSPAAHTAVLLQNPDTLGLEVCQAYVAAPFWPVDGIQCAPWLQWTGFAETAQLSATLAPLAANEPFDNEAAWSFVSAHLGLDYGFPNMLFPWWDVGTENYPCTPEHNFTVCETLPHEMLKVVMIDQSAGDGEHNPYRAALNHRLRAGSSSLGVAGWADHQQPPPQLPVLDVMRLASQLHGWSFTDLVTQPELDAWRYRLRRYGNETVSDARSMVCSVLVCLVWKAAGIFADAPDLQCSEQTPWDIFAMKVFDGNRTGSGRPRVCQEADPRNPLCQLMGDVTLFPVVSDFNSRPLRNGMGNHCPSKAPFYDRPLFC